MERALQLSKTTVAREDLSSERHNIIKRFLNQMLKIVKIFVNATIQANHSEEEAGTLHLLRKNSSIVEDDKANEPADAKDGKKEAEEFKTETKAADGASVPYYGPYAPDNPTVYGPSPPPSASNADKSDQKGGTAGEGASTTKPAGTEPEILENNLRLEFEKTPRFRQIVEQIRSSQIAGEIVASTNFSALQANLLEIMSLFITKPGKSKGPDDSIICNAMALWTAALIENHPLIDAFYVWERPNVQESDEIKTAADLLLNGIYSPKASIVRASFKDNFELIAEKVTKNRGVLPLYYLIKTLKDNMPNAEMTIPTKDSGEFFKLLGALIIQY